MEGKREVKEHKELFKNALWLFSSKSAKSVITAVETIILARILGVDKFGQLSIIIAYVAIINRFVDFRVWEGLIKYVGEYLEKNDKEKALSVIKLSYCIDFVSGTSAFIISVILAFFATSFFNLQANSIELIVIYSLSLFINTANTTSEAIFRVFNEFKKITYLSTFEASIRLIFVVAALYMDYGLVGVLSAYVAASAIGFINRQYFVGIVLKGEGIKFWVKGKVKYLQGRYREIMWFFFNTTVGGTLRIADDNYLGVLALGHYFGSDLAGLYKIARSSIKIMTRFVDPLYEAIYPKMVEMITRKTYDDLRNIINYAVKNLYKFTLPVAALILIFAGYILDIIFGQEYVTAANTMRVIAVGAIVNQIAFWISPVLLAMNKVGVRTFYNIMEMVIYVILLIVLIPRFGLIGAGYAYLFNRVAVSIIGIALFNYYFKTNLSTSP